MTYSLESFSLKKITNGITNDQWKATGVSIDTRTLKKGDLFCAIKGKNFDGHDFIKKAFEMGAVAALVNKNKKVLQNKSYLKVNNVLKAIEKIAINNRTKSKSKFIAVTGSVGKTGTKEMLKMSLNKVAKVYVNEGSLNNHIGVPLTLCKLPDNTDYSVLELGMNRLGEIEKLSRIVMPQVGIITAIENSHLSGLKTLRKIAQAKCELLSYLSRSGCFIFNNDTNFGDYLFEKAKSLNIKSIISYGKKQSSNIRLLEYKLFKDRYLIKAVAFGKEVNWQMPPVNEHWIHNSLSVLAVAIYYNLNLKKTLLGLKNFEVPHGRGNKIKGNFNGKDFTIINDSYNSSPASLSASLLSLKRENPKGKKILLLGDMLELGKKSLKLHLNLKKNVISSGVALLITKGKYMKELNDILPSNIEKYHEEEEENIIKTICKKISHDDLLLIKGSNSIGLGKIVTILKKINHYDI